MRRTSHPGGDLRILLIEDNPFDEAIIEAALQVHLGCHILTVATQLELETELERHSPDFILSDSDVPSCDGLSALTLARQIRPDVPFIFCSGAISEKARQEAMAHGATDCISKNNLESLIALIKRLSEKSHEHGGDFR